MHENNVEVCCDFCGSASNVSAHNGHLFCDECFEQITIPMNEIIDEL